jgi:hypothetical protein
MLQVNSILEVGMKRAVQGDKEAFRPAEEGGEGGEHSGHDGSRTAGTNRDLDESGESDNQGHGHPRDRQGRGEDAGHSERTVTETDRQQRDLGGPGV